MKKLHIVRIAYILTGLLLAFVINALSPCDILERFKNPDHARQASSFYEETTLLYTVENEDRYVDFLIDEEGYLLVVTIKRSRTLTGLRYEANQGRGYDIESNAETFTSRLTETGETPWQNSVFFNKQRYAPVYWTLLDASCEIAETDVVSQTITLGDKTYNFCVESYLTGDGTDVYEAVESWKVGDVVDLEGFLYWYNAAQPHITSVKAAQ